MKRLFFSLLLIVFGLNAMAQQTIQLRSADKAECVKSDMTSLKASFSFSTIEAQDYESQRGTFSWLSLPNTVIGGNEGDPQIPVVNQLIAMPFGANPRIEITSYSTTDYRLDDYGIHTLVPRQPSLRKDQRPEDVPFVYNESAYQTRGFRSEPMAVVSMEGTMRGIQVGKMTIEPVSYDPVSNTLRVFNDIEVEVHFDGADARATEDLLVKTYTPYFDIIYKQLFNGRAVLDVYSQHPDLYTTPVKMIVITTATYANNATFQNWVNWKKQKGIYTTVYTTATTGTSSSSIKSFIRNKYNTDAPTFVVIVGDTGDVTYSLSSSTTSKVTDLYYSSTTDSDLYPEMFLSRMPVSSTTELTNLLNKIMTYEQYTMADPSYLGNTLLIAGWDSSWTKKVGKPTIQYANTYYFNSSNNINPYVFLTTGSGQTTCYNYINNVGFANYTAHGGETGWSDPSFSVSNVNSMTNNDKYLWAMGNCCLAANWGYSGTCFAEALLRAANKGAFGYIGSCPETYWWEDYYFGVGATTVYNQMPTMAQTQTGVYDAMFDDSGFNTLNSVPFIGNIAVAYAHSGSYTSSVSDRYYWEAYHTLGDGSVMPYHTVPAANNVSHAAVMGIGATTFTVSADAGSYVSITKNNEILGVAQVGSTGTVDVPITPVNTADNVMVVVTRNQRQPYITTIPVVGGQQYTITATANPSDAGTVTGAGLLYESTICTLTAVANSGWDFVDWNDGNTENPRSFTVTSDASFTANFTTVPERNITLAAVMHGTINCDHTTAYKNDLITLTATPASGYNLESWVVFKTGDVNTTVTVTDNAFVMPDYDVTVSAIFSKPVSGDVTIGSGSNTNEYLPTHSWYKYTLTQQIYKPSELGIAGTITKVAFKVANSKSTTRTIDIYMSHTNTNAFSGNSAWIAQGDSYRVFSGSVTFNASGWTTITLNTPFEYNGTSNLLLTVDDNTGSYVSGQNNSPTFYVYATNGNTSLGKYNDNTNYDPTSMTTSGSRAQTNNQVMFTKEVPSTEGYLSVSHIFLNGFETEAGLASEPQSIAVIGNNLQANLTITAPEGFEVCATSDGTYNNTLILTPSNGSLLTNVFVRLGTSLVPGDYSGNMTLTSGTTSVTVNLSGTVVNSTPRYTINATANPSEGGIVYFGESLHSSELVYDFEDGTTQGWTMLQGPNGDSPDNWMHCADYLAGTYSFGSGHNASEGFMLSESFTQDGASVHPDNYLVSPQIQLGGSISFWATNMDYEYGAEHVAVAVSTNGNTDADDFTTVQEWTLPVGRTGGTRTIDDGTWYEYTADLSTFSGLGYVAIHHFDCYDQWLLCVDDITIVEGYPATASGIFTEGESCTVTAIANEGYTFVNWTEDGETVSTDAVYSFEVTADRALIANFEPSLVEQTISLTAGWNWFSTYVEITLNDLKTALVEALPGTSITIKSQSNGNISYNGSTWRGALNSLDVTRMYMISVSTDCEITLTGVPINPAEHPVTIYHGVNWIAFPLNQSMTVSEVFAGVAVSGDKVKSQTSTSNYNGTSWRPNIALEPGQGYIYNAATEGERTFIFEMNK